MSTMNQTSSGNPKGSETAGKETALTFGSVNIASETAGASSSAFKNGQKPGSCFGMSPSVARANALFTSTHNSKTKMFTSKK